MLAYREGELRHTMAPSGTLVLRTVELRDKKMPIEESTMPDRHDKNIEKVFPVFGHRFVAKVSGNVFQDESLWQAFNEFVYCAVDRDFIWGFGKQAIRCFLCNLSG